MFRFGNYIFSLVTVLATNHVKSEVYPTHFISECDRYEDQTGLMLEMSEVLNSALNFVNDSGVTFNPDEEESDPKKLPKLVLTECLTILHQLGPWCAGKVASALRRQLDKIIEHVYMPQLTKQFAQVNNASYLM